MINCQRETSTNFMLENRTGSLVVIWRNLPAGPREGKKSTEFSRFHLRFFHWPQCQIQIHCWWEAIDDVINPFNTEQNKIRIRSECEGKQAQQLLKSHQGPACWSWRKRTFQVSTFMLCHFSVSEVWAYSTPLSFSFLIYKRDWEQNISQWVIAKNK